MKALLLYPKFPISFWSMKGALELTSQKALLPPLGLITVAAMLPQEWDMRLIDCNVEENIPEETWEWADIVLFTGMIVQKTHMLDLITQAKQRGKAVAVGGPYVTSVPQDAQNAGADFLVLDEGEITIPLFIDALNRGDKNGYFTASGEKPDLRLTPIPRYDLLDLSAYMEMSIQFSRGCPFLCEFCDIIVLYGRRPRTKTAEQVIAELNTLYDLGWRRDVFVVDDNFIGNKKTVKPVLVEMAKWQKEKGYPYSLTTEASVDLADDPVLLELMQETNFTTVFLGIETPDVESLKATRKNQNIRHSLNEQVRTITKAGIRIFGGFIIGFDGEKSGADQRILSFIKEVGVAHAIINMLYALPRTALTERLIAEGRLHEDHKHTTDNATPISNFMPTRPLRELSQELIYCFITLYEPRAFGARLHKQYMDLNRKPKKKKAKPLKLSEIKTVCIILWRNGVVRDGQGLFWRNMLDVFLKNRVVFKSYLTSFVHYEHFYEYRMHIKENLENQLDQLSDEILDSVYVVQGQKKPEEELKVASE